MPGVWQLRQRYRRRMRRLKAVSLLLLNLLFLDESGRHAGENAPLRTSAKRRERDWFDAVELLRRQHAAADAHLAQRSSQPQREKESCGMSCTTSFSCVCSLIMCELYRGSHRASLRAVASSLREQSTLRSLLRMGGLSVSVFLRIFLLINLLQQVVDPVHLIRGVAFLPMSPTRRVK